jgi:beta-mannanase
LKVVGDELEALQTAGISVVLRRLQEGSGKWFWLGYNGWKSSKKLCKNEIESFTKEKTFGNLLWVFTAGIPNTNIQDWYPGDDMVDII